MLQGCQLIRRNESQTLDAVPKAILLGTLSLSLMAFSLPVAADDDLFFSDLPIVASVSRLPQRLADAPTAVTVIDRATIKASGARSLSDILRLVPGFQTFASSDVASRVTYHGITDEDFSPRVQVMVDGRSLHSPLFRNGMNWALVPVALDDIERIEVVRGSNTTSYGSNAFLGVINIITVDPALVRGVSIAVNNGNQGVRDFSLRGASQLGESGNFRLTYQQLGDDGLNERSVPSNDRSWRDRNKSRLLDVKAHFQLDVRDLLELQFGKVEGTRLTGRVVPATGAPRASDPLRDLDESSTWLQLRWLRTLSDTADFSLRYTYGEDEADSSFTVVHPLIPPDYSKINENGGRGTRHEIEAVHTLLPFENTRLIWGASWRLDTVQSKTMLRGMGKVDRDVGRIFANSEWRPTHWFTGNLGVSYEHDSLADEHFAPRASASFHLTPNNTVRVGYARAWRTPGTLDFKANQRVTPTVAQWVGNRDLPSERLDSWELGYLGDWRPLRMSLDVRLFRERLSDRLLHQIRTGERPAGLTDEPYTVQSIQDIRINGYELQWKWQASRSTRIALGHANVRINGKNSKNGQRIEDFDNPRNNYRRNVPLYTALAEESAPRRSTSILLMQQLPYGIDLSVAHYKVGPMKWTRNTSIDGYERTDMRIAYPFSFGTQRGELAYTVQSLNGAHSEQRIQRVVDRRHWVSVRMDF